MSSSNDRFLPPESHHLGQASCKDEEPNPRLGITPTAGLS